MSTTSDGLILDTFVQKHKLQTVCPHSKLRDIIITDVKLLNPRQYKASMAFHLYAFDRLEAGEEVDISVDTFTRCVNLTMSDSPALRASKDSLTVQHLHETLRKNKSLFDKIDTPYFKSANKPLQAASDMMYTNIINYVTTNFIEFQKRYIHSQLTEYLTDNSVKTLTYPQLGYTAYRAQNLVHNHLSLINDEFLHDSFKPKKYHALKDKLKSELPVFARKMRDDVPLELRGKITDIMLKKNLSAVVSYIYRMAKYLDSKRLKSFSPLPNPSIERHHMLFDIQYLATVYNKWKKKEDKHAKLVTFAEFRDNFPKYRTEMFCIDKLYPEFKGKYNVKSITTDGYAISLIFTGRDVKSKYTKGAKRPTAKTKKYESDKKFRECKILTTTKLAPGLYDATKIRMKTEDLNKYQTVGVDPGNYKMLNFMKSDGEMFTVTKGYYNEISHITRNTHKKQQIIQTDTKMSEINTALSETCIRSASRDQYVAYMKIVADNWEFLWKYKQNKRFSALRYDTYINSKRAISRICREIRSEVVSYGNKKPVILAFGNGNGNMTINNTKNSSSHGPIKRIAKALSVNMRVVVTDEYNTSKLCSECDAKLHHPKTHRTESYKKMYKQVFNRKPGIGIVKRLKSFMNEYHPTHKPKVIKNERSYALCCCKSKDHTSDNRLRNRDYHGSKNLRRVMRARITGELIPAFERPKKKKSSVKKHEVKNTKVQKSN